GPAAVAAKFEDRTASWISPLPAQVNQTGAYCPQIPGGTEAIVESKFTIATAGTYTVELLADDAAYLTIYRTDEPSGSHSVFTLAASEFGYVAEAVRLEPGAYSVLIKNWDKWAFATAVAASIEDSGGAVVKHTTNDGTWFGSIAASGGPSL